MDVLEDVWIVTQGGITCWNKQEHFFERGQLIGMLMCALNALSKRMTKLELHNFEVGKKRFYILKGSELIFVGTSRIEVDQKIAEEQLEQIRDKFFKNYSKETFVNWNNDIGPFYSFS